VVTLRITTFNTEIFYVLPTQNTYVLFYMGFITNNRYKNNYYFHIQHSYVGFITETESVYCAVRAEG